MSGKHHISEKRATKSERQGRRLTSTHPKATACSGRGDFRSFLFVVNELRISNRWCLSQPITGNVLPPNDFRGFTGETSGRVFRYSNGFIEEAPDYWWERPQEMDSPGNIVTYDRDETGGCTVDENGECNIFVTADFATCVAFDCWRFAPRLFSWVDPFDQDEAIEWFFPRFLESPVNPGVSIVNGQGYRYTIGRNSGWGVIPQTFNHPSANAPQSRGLSGDLSLILGLMALTRDVGRTDDIASRWNGPGHPWTGHSIVDLEPDATPRGVLVHVALDPSNSEGSSRRILDEMIANDILVPTAHP